MKIHELKTLPQYFVEQVKGAKQFEVRLNDRNFEVGDVLILKEYDNGYTGTEICVRVTYVLKDFIGLKDGWVVLGTEPLIKEEQDLYEELERYKEALDKACDMLIKMKKCCNCWEFENDCPFVNCCIDENSNSCYNKSKWKEWCLKDE